jgi:mono/diheme cytochrome c family protein
MNPGTVLRPLVIVTVLSPLLGSGCERPRVFDRAEIQARYEFRHIGQCNAWVQSALTGYRYCSSPPLGPDVPVLAPVSVTPAFASKADGPTDEAALREHGASVYGGVCASCHQANGEGLGASFPPLAGNGGFYGTPENHARIIVHGLSGPINVAGKDFNGAMPPQGAALTDYDIAAVATFERTSWGNADGLVTPEQVASQR